MTAPRIHGGVPGTLDRGGYGAMNPNALSTGLAQQQGTNDDLLALNQAIDHLIAQAETQYQQVTGAADTAQMQRDKLVKALREKLAYFQSIGDATQAAAAQAKIDQMTGDRTLGKLFDQVDQAASSMGGSIQRSSVEQ